jgi:hypothetical protein
MSTTKSFQKKPDYYKTVDECKSSRKKIVTNPRYREFKQTHFTAGDNDQFNEYRDKTNGDIYTKKINLDNNIFVNEDFSEEISWSKYNNLKADCVDNTFNYMFNKFKKGVFVKIKDNELKVFLPFSKNGFINEWGDRINIDPKFGTMYKFVTYINRMMGKHYKVSVNSDTDSWYANNCLIRSEYPINEGDTNIPNISDMLRDLCANRTVPDMEFFINRRDFPVIKKNGTEAYEHIFGDNHPLLSHNYDKFSPILSMVTSDEHSDIPIPTGDDWARIGSYEGKIFGDDCKTYPKPEEFIIEWKDKKPTAMFRGASTGCGVTIDSNIRLNLAYISANTPPDSNGLLIDAGISKWQTRPRKLKNEKYLKTINVPDMNKLGIKLASFVSPLQQSGYKYIINVDGHVSAFRLSLEMCMGCCILLADSKYRLWFRKLMKPMVHYIPIKEDLSDMIETIKWCREHDKECENIANNAKQFYFKYLQRDGALDYVQKILIDLKTQTGMYLYNTETPLQRQIGIEKNLDLTYPHTDKTVSDIGVIPRQGRSIGILKGLEWIINMVNMKSNFIDVATKGEIIFENRSKTVKVQKYKLADFSFVIKSSTDITKQQENIHEAYIGTKVINDIVKYIPNFAYIFGKFDSDTNNNVIMENINGQTFDKWLQSSNFNMKDYIFILIQLSMALEVAQNKGGFVHYDLTPWNIIIQRINTPIEFDYLLDVDNVFRVTTNIIPVIIDYGKSHIIYEQEHHGYINMYKMSTIQDIISILLTSLNIITQFNLSNRDISDMINLSNFMSGTGYRRDTFTSVSDIKKFISKAKKYSEMVSSDKHELEQKTPRDFIYYIKKVFKYNFNYEKIGFPTFRINRGNPHQVFDYILSSSIHEKTQSFINVFKRVIECEFPMPGNLFFVYYTAQTIEENITSVNTLMLYYLNNQNLIEPDTMYKKAMEKIHKMYIEKMSQTLIQKVDYTISDCFKNPSISTYNEDTFNRPDIILKILLNYKKSSEDISTYKNIVEDVYINKGIFKMTDDHKKYYLDNFRDLLYTKNVNMKTYTANINTLKKVSKEIYITDKENIDKKLRHKKPNMKQDKSINEYMSTYKEIQEFLDND